MSSNDTDNCLVKPLYGNTFRSDISLKIVFSSIFPITRVRPCIRSRNERVKDIAEHSIQQPDLPYGEMIDCLQYILFDNAGN